MLSSVLDFPQKETGVWGECPIFVMRRMAHTLHD